MADSDTHHERISIRPQNISPQTNMYGQIDIAETLEKLDESDRSSLLSYLVNPDSLKHMPTVVNLLRCDLQTFRMQHDIIKYGKPAKVIENLNPTLSSLPDYAWDTVTHLENDAQKFALANQLEIISQSNLPTQGLLLSSNISGRNSRGASLLSVDSNTETMSMISTDFNDASDRDLSGDEQPEGMVATRAQGQSNEGEVVQNRTCVRRKQSHSRKPQRGPFICTVPGCPRLSQDSGSFQKEGWCRRHILSDHENISREMLPNYIRDMSAPVHSQPPFAHQTGHFISNPLLLNVQSSNEPIRGAGHAFQGQMFEETRIDHPSFQQLDRFASDAEYLNTPVSGVVPSNGPTYTQHNPRFSSPWSESYGTVNQTGIPIVRVAPPESEDVVLMNTNNDLQRRRASLGSPAYEGLPGWSNFSRD